MTNALREARTEAEKILKENKALLEKLADELEKRETLSGAEIKRIIQSE